MSAGQNNNENQIKQRTKSLLPRLKCAFHQNQSLTNFCSSKKCLLPLCPSCIKIHTIEHLNMKTDPQYQSLIDVVVGFDLDLKDFIQVYQDNHRLFTEVQQKVNDFKQEIYHNIDNLKKTIIEQVQTYFKEIAASTQQKISNMPYISQLQTYKCQLKKSLLIIKSLQKNLLNNSSSGKSLIRNLIKYQSQNMDQHLNKFDIDSREFISRLQGNFCTLSIRENLKDNFIGYLTDVFRININEIPINHHNQEKITKLTQKLESFVDHKNLDKMELKCSLNSVVSKASQIVNKVSQKKNSQSRLNKLNHTLSYQNKQINEKQNSPVVGSYSILARKPMGNPRRISNHLSQSKSVNISSSFYQPQNQSCYLTQNSQNSRCEKSQYRSTSKGKGLTLMHVNRDTKQVRNSTGMRFSLAGIDNINLDLVSNGVNYAHRRK